jgi:ATP-dependent DNA helicase RecQ
VRGKATEKVRQYGHERLSTFGLGSQYSEAQLRAVLRQLMARGALGVDAQNFNTLTLTAASRAVLRGEQAVTLRQQSPQTPSRQRRAAADAQHAALGARGQARLQALRAWRSEVARAHNLPAYAIFHDVTLLAIAAQQPGTLDALRGISGMGHKKLAAYGDEVLRVLRDA